jgi:hypothetical protein
MGDTPDLGSGAARRGGSSPLPGKSLLLIFFVSLNKRYKLVD